MKRTLTLMCAAALGAVSVVAQEAPARGWQVMAGAGAMAVPRYAGSEHMKIRALPALYVDGPLDAYTRLRVNGPAVELWRGAADNPVHYGLKARYEFGRDDDADLMVRGLPDVDPAVGIGPVVSVALGQRASVDGEVLGNVGGPGGFRARGGVSYRQQHGPTRLVARAGLNYASDDVMDAYFSVPAHAVRNDRPAFTADGGLSHVDVGIMALHPLGERWVLQGMAGADYLMGDAADSPLAERNLQPRVGLGLMYRFY